MSSQPIQEPSQRDYSAEIIPDHYKAIFYNVPVGLTVWHIENLNDIKSIRLISANKASGAHAGADLRDFIGTTLFEAFPNIYEKTDLPNKYLEVIKTQKPVTLKDIHYGDQTIPDAYFDIQVYPLPGNCFGLIFENVSRRKKADEELQQYRIRLEDLVNERTIELKENKERYDLALEATSDGVWDWNIATNEEYYSPRWCAILGYAHDDPGLLHTYDSWASRIHPDDYERVMNAVKDHLNRGKNYDVDYRHRHKSGEYRWQNSQGKAILDNNGKAIRMVGCIRDISERKNAEEALRKSEEFNNRIIESSNDCIKVLDVDGNLLSMNQGGQRLLEIENIAPYLNNSWVDFWEGEARDAARAAISKAKKGGVGVFNGFCETAKGTPKWWEVIISPIENRQGEVENLVAISRDITQRIKSEEDLVLFRKMIDNSSDSIFLVDAETARFLDTNENGYIARGYTRDELLSSSVLDVAVLFKNMDDWKRFAETVKEKGTLTKETEHRCKDGRRFPVEVNARYVDDHDKPYFVAVVRDITNRKNTAHLLEEQNLALEQKNAALQELVEFMERTKENQKENIDLNLNELIIPSLEKLKKRGASAKLINLIENNLFELTSAFGRRIRHKHTKLTPREIEICNMIKSNLTSKEIARSLNLSLDTVVKHRKNIRRKLGISKSKENLTTLLKNL